MKDKYNGGDTPKSALRIFSRELIHLRALPDGSHRRVQQVRIRAGIEEHDVAPEGGIRKAILIGCFLGDPAWMNPQ